MGQLLEMNQLYSITIKQWHAWAPNRITDHDWQQWAQKPVLTVGEGMPDVSVLPAMQRRRMNRLARMCYTVVQAIEGSAGLPQIYCSRHGDLARSTDLLLQLAQKEPLSAASFGLSVHNAAGAAVSILQGNTQPVTSIAAGQDGVRQAFYEVLAHLHEYPQVLLVVYDDVLPMMYQESASPVFAYALLIERGQRVELNFQARPTNLELPLELSVLAQVVRNERQLNLSAKALYGK